MVIGYLLLSSEFKHYFLFKKISLSSKYLKSLLKMGIPISIQFSIELLAFSTLTYLIGRVGIIPLSAQQITMQYSMLTIMVIMGISQASSILVSQKVGQKQFNELKKLVYTSLTLGGVVILCLSFICLFNIQALVNLYINKDDANYLAVLDLTKIFLYITVCGQIFDVCRNITAGILRGFGDTQSSMWTSLFSFWIVGLPIGIILTLGYTQNGIGLKFGITLGIFLGAFMLIKRLSKHLIISTSGFIPVTSNR